jgi:Tfp pilus assembly protein PilZ
MAATSRFVQRYRRLNLRVPARVTTLDAVRDGAAGERYFRVSEETCANLSEGGAFVATHQPIQQDCRVMLEIELPDGQSVQTVGRVVWSQTELASPGRARASGQASGIGVAFTRAAPDQADLLERYLTKNLPRRRTATSTPLVTVQGRGA